MLPRALPLPPRRQALCGSKIRLAGNAGWRISITVPSCRNGVDCRFITFIDTYLPARARRLRLKLCPFIQTSHIRSQLTHDLQV
jgi:hypothetical protein